MKASSPSQSQFNSWMRNRSGFSELLQKNEGVVYESDCRKCQKDTIKDIGRSGYTADDGQD
ncbi:hypothetical protein CE91St64_22270 [Faecalicatena contorta]|nr:hypothetical protein CE91St64_22270 [Faecalicatena contorta]